MPLLLAIAPPSLSFSRFLLGLFLLCLTTTSLWAEGIGLNKSFFLVHDFKDDWQVYDEQYKAYVPYLKERHQNYNSFSLFLNLEDAKGYHLLYSAKNENYLFINASLQKKLPANQWITLNSDSLFKIYRKNEIFLTFFSTHAGVEDKTVLIGNKILVGKTPIFLTTDETQQIAQPRQVFGLNDFFIIIGLFLFASYAYLLHTQTKSFGRYFNIQDLLTISKRNDSVVERPFDSSNMLFMLHLSLMLSYTYMLVISKGLTLFGGSQLLEESDTFYSLLWTYFRISVLTVFLFFGKYTLLNLLGQLYHLEKIINTHYFKIIQSSSLFFMSATSFMVFFFFAYSYIAQEIANMLVITIIVFFLVRLALLYFTINKLASIKNLYLFSYLCIVELIPIIVGIRFAL